MTTINQFDFILNLHEENNFKDDATMRLILSTASVEYKKRAIKELLKKTKHHYINNEIFICKATIFNFLKKMNIYSAANSTINNKINNTNKDTDTAFKFFQRTNEAGRSGKKEYIYPLSKVELLIDELLTIK